MPWLRSTALEIWRLFVDDGRVVLAILGWLAILWMVLPHLAIPVELKGPILFAGLAVLLVYSALRRARP